MDPSEETTAMMGPEPLSAHTKSLIAHLASLPGFGQTRARISYVPYTAPEPPAGSTIAELQLPWRSSTSISALGGGGGTTADASYASTSGGASSPNSLNAITNSSAQLRCSKTASLARRRGTIIHLLRSLSVS